nr:hypothetical protein [uncultured Cohaesibacter sp.]
MEGQFHRETSLRQLSYWGQGKPLHASAEPKADRWSIVSKDNRTKKFKDIRDIFLSYQETPHLLITLAAL